MRERIIILDFGLAVYSADCQKIEGITCFCEIFPYNALPEDYMSSNGIILSGSPFSVLDANALYADLSCFAGKLPILGICYGAQLTAHQMGGKVSKTLKGIW